MHGVGRKCRCGYLLFHICMIIFSRLFGFFFVSLIYSSCYAMIAPPFRTPSRHARSSHAHDNKGHVDFVVRKRESLSSHLLHADFVGLLNAQHNLGYLCHY